MKPRLYPSFLLAGLLAFSFASAGAAEEPGIIKFSDPGKPGTVKISLGRGELQVTGADTQEVTVKSEAKAATSKPRKDGLRVLSAASSYALKEKDNVVTLDAAAHDGGQGSGDFKLTVPRNTNIVIQNAWGGDIAITGLSGDLEINCMHGEIKLDGVAGGAVVSTMNGEIRANIRELREGKPLSFTSMNGEVVLRVPADAKANVRLRTQNGSVLTDFEESALVTKTESSPGMPRISKVSTLRGRQVITTEVQDAIREAAHAGATAVKEALEAVKEGLEAAKLDSDQARQDLDKADRGQDTLRVALRDRIDHGGGRVSEPGVALEQVDQHVAVERDAVVTRQRHGRSTPLDRASERRSRRATRARTRPGPIHTSPRQPQDRERDPRVASVEDGGSAHRRR